MPERVYQQEIEAAIPEDGGSVFRNLTANMTAPVDPEPAAHASNNRATIVMGCGENRRGALVGCVIRQRRTGGDRFNQIDYHLQGAAVAGTGREVGVKASSPNKTASGMCIFEVEALQRLVCWRWGS